MTEPLSVDPAVLVKGAADFERIADRLRDELAKVESIAAGLSNHWRGGAADATQHVIQAFHRAAAGQVKALNDISNSLQTAAAHYANTDDEQSRVLASQMGMGGAEDEANGKSGTGVRLVDNVTRADPTINNDATKPVPESTGDDLDDTIPNSGVNIGGDGAHHHPYLDGKPNPLDTNDGTRPLPTGTAQGPDGRQLAFYSQPPYDIKQPDGTTVKNPSFVTPNSAIVDLSDPAKIIGKAPVAQASGVYDKDTNTMFVVGNPDDGHGNTRELWQSAPVDPANPNAWANSWTKVGDVMPGNRENQITALKGGGYLLTGAADGDGVRGVTASSPEGLVGKTQGDLLVPDGPDGVVNVYGPTVVTDHFDPVAETDTIGLRVSQYGPPDQPEVYDPRTFTSTFTVAQPPPPAPEMSGAR